MKVKVEVEVPDYAFELISEILKDYQGVTVSLEELKANPKVAEWLSKDLGNYFEHFFDQEYLWEMDMAEPMGYEPMSDEDDEEAC